MTTNSWLGRILELVQESIGTPFHPQGRLRGVGLDCAGLALAISKDMGVLRHDKADYNVTKLPRGFLDGELEKAFDRIPLEEATDGDIVSFWTREDGCAEHMAILTPNDRMVHACLMAGRVVEISRHSWMKKAVSAFRFPGDGGSQWQR